MGDKVVRQAILPSTPQSSIDTDRVAEDWALFDESGDPVDVVGVFADFEARIAALEAA